MTDNTGELIQANGGSSTFANNPISNPSGTNAPLLVTSGPSRATYANNVSTLNGALSNMSSSPTKLPTPKYGDDVKDNAGNVVGKAKYDPNTGEPLSDPTKSEANVTTSEDTNDNGIDPGIQKQYDDTVNQLDQSISQAKSSLDAVSATLANDPSASAAVSAISAKYDQLIQTTKDKNKILLGSYKTNNARDGMTQYANEMDSDFMSEEMDKATQRVTDLVTQEQTAILKSNQAYKDGDIKAFNDATKAYNDANKNKTDAINKLLVASDKAVKEKQTEAKQLKADQKQEVTDNIRISTSLSSVVATNLKASNITDPAKRRAYIEQMADSAGITNPDILESAVDKAEQTQTRQDLLNKSTQKNINKTTPVKSPTQVKAYSTFKTKPTAGDISKINKYIVSIGGNQAAIDAANADEATFYKVLNAVPSSGSVAP